MKNTDKRTKILIVSHNCFSQSGSNGRTLGNFFKNWNQDDIAQFYINNEISDSQICSNFYRVTDIEVLKSFFQKKNIGRVLTRDITIQKEIKDSKMELLYKKNRKKNSLRYLIRNFIWNRNCWRNEKFFGWVNEFNPDIVLLQLGDYEFMLKIAREIAQSRNIPLIIYNSEDYYFKNDKNSILYKLFKYNYKKEFKKLINYSSHSIYITEFLEQEYQNEFKHKSSTIMPITELKFNTFKENKTTDKLKMAYLGNLGLGRHKSLIEIGKTIKNIDSNMCLEIYGKAPNDEIANELYNAVGIVYKGFVTYDYVKKIMNESDILFHAENFSEFTKKDLKNGFSGKISDSLGSGAAFFIYAPEEIASVKYLKENNAACVVTNNKELEEKLKKIILNQDYRKKLIEQAVKLCNKNHQLDINILKFNKIIESIKVGKNNENSSS